MGDPAWTGNDRHHQFRRYEVVILPSVFARAEADDATIVWMDNGYNTGNATYRFADGDQAAGLNLRIFARVLLHIAS
jgi:hypothetical protein